MSLYVMNTADYRLVQHTVRARVCRRGTQIKYANWHEAHRVSHVLLHGPAHQCCPDRITVSEIEADFGAMDLLVPSDLWARHVEPLGPALQPGDILGWRALLAQGWEAALSVPWERLGVHLLRTKGDAVNFSLWETYVINHPIPPSQLMAVLERDFLATWTRWSHQGALLDRVAALG